MRLLNLVADGIVISLIVGFLRKGNLKALASLKLKFGWVFPVLLIIQLIVFSLQNDLKFLGQASGYIYIIVYIVGLVFLFMNRHHKGFFLIWIGVLLNFIVITLNGGRMPVSIESASVLDPSFIDAIKNELYAKHSALTAETKLGFLGDIIPLSNPYPRTQVISIGDVVMNIGIFLFIQHLMTDHLKSNPSESSSLSLEGGDLK